MKTPFNLGSEKMPIILDQPESDSHTSTSRNLNMLDLVNEPSDYNGTIEQNFSEGIHLDIRDLNEENKLHKSENIDGEFKKDWNLQKYVPDDMFENDKIDNFSCSAFKGKKNDLNKYDYKKIKKKDKTNYKNCVNMSTVNFSNNDFNTSEVFLNKQCKEKNGDGKTKKYSNKSSKEKAYLIKKNYKPIAPYPSSNDQKLSVIPTPVPKLINPHVNPILLVKIDDQQQQGLNDEKQKMQDYLDYSDKRIQDPDYVQSYSYETTIDNDYDLKNMKNFMSKTKCYKCYNCSFITLNKDFLNYHFQKKQKCYSNNEVFHCPGCKNIFFSLTPLRVHLVHDHKMLSKEVKTILQSVQEVRFEVEGEKSSCIFQSNEFNTMKENLFNSNSIPDLDMPINVENRSEIEKTFNAIPPDKHVPDGREIERCVNGKRQTMLESYLDDINNKGDCNLPPTLNNNGSALLENTFKLV